MEQLKKDIAKLNDKATDYLTLRNPSLKNIGHGMRQVLNVVNDYIERTQQKDK